MQIQQQVLPLNESKEENVRIVIMVWNVLAFIFIFTGENKSLYYRKSQQQRIQHDQQRDVQRKLQQQRKRYRDVVESPNKKQKCSEARTVDDTSSSGSDVTASSRKLINTLSYTYAENPTSRTTITTPPPTINLCDGKPFRGRGYIYLFLI